MKPTFSLHILTKCSNIKFHENLSSGSWFVPCKQTEITKLIVTLHNIANAPKTHTQKRNWVEKEGMPSENRAYGSPIITNTG